MMYNLNVRYARCSTISIIGILQELIGSFWRVAGSDHRPPDTST